MDLFAEARHRMVDEQIAARGVRDPRVLAAMRSVPRHEFAGAANRAMAYADRALPIASGQTISQPYMVALMTEALRLRDDARVLEIGTGSGYQAAVLACIARELVSIERHPDLAAAARERLDALGFQNVDVIVGDGTRGCADRAPFDGIMVTAGAPAVPAALREQLADGARLVIPIGSAYLQHLTVVVRDGDTFRESVNEACAFVPLIGEQGWRVDER
jgi:protein-L-isoaspartate(D-aspartate) O-methyltransferase